MWRYCRYYCCGKSSLAAIKNQIAWIDKREPSSNRLGMLRSAIEGNWAPPPSVQVRERERKLWKKQKEREAREILEDERREAEARKRREKWLSRPRSTQERLRRTAIENAHPTVRSYLERQPTERPAAAFLMEMEKDQLQATADVP